MPIQIASNIVPKNSQTFYMVEDVFIKGGFQIQDNIAGRDAIAFGNLKLGQLVLTTDTGIIWKLTSLAGPTIAAPDTPQGIGDSTAPGWPRSSGCKFRKYRGGPTV